MLATGTLDKILKHVQVSVDDQERAILEGAFSDLAEYHAACRMRRALLGLESKVKELAQSDEDWED